MAHSTRPKPPTAVAVWHSSSPRRASSRSSRQKPLVPNSGPPLSPRHVYVAQGRVPMVPTSPRKAHPSSCNLNNLVKGSPDYGEKLAPVMHKPPQFPVRQRNHMPNQVEQPKATPGSYPSRAYRTVVETSGAYLATPHRESLQQAVGVEKCDDSIGEQNVQEQLSDRQQWYLMQQALAQSTQARNAQSETLASMAALPSQCSVASVVSSYDKRQSEVDNVPCSLGVSTSDPVPSASTQVTIDVQHAAQEYQQRYSLSALKSGEVPIDHAQIMHSTQPAPNQAQLAQEYNKQLYSSAAMMRREVQPSQAHASVWPRATSDAEQAAQEYQQRYSLSSLKSGEAPTSQTHSSSAHANLTSNSSAQEATSMQQAAQQYQERYSISALKSAEIPTSQTHSSVAHTNRMSNISAQEATSMQQAAKEYQERYSFSSLKNGEVTSRQVQSTASTQAASAMESF